MDKLNSIWASNLVQSFQFQLAQKAFAKVDPNEVDLNLSEEYSKEVFFWFYLVFADGFLLAEVSMKQCQLSE